MPYTEFTLPFASDYFALSLIIFFNLVNNVSACLACKSYVISDQGGVQENYYSSPGAEIPVQTGSVHTEAHCLDEDQGRCRGDQAEASPEQTESGVLG